MKNDRRQKRDRTTTSLLTLLTFCLVLTGVFFIAPIEAEAAVGDTFTSRTGMTSSTTQPMIQYEILSEGDGNNTVKVESLVYGGGTTKVNIPSTITHDGIEYTVVMIGNRAFDNYSNYITEITLPDTVTYIGAYAFTGCTKMESFTVPKNVTTIENNAFTGADSLKELIILSENTLDLSNLYGNSYSYINTSVEKLVLGKGVSSVWSKSYNMSYYMDALNLTELTLYTDSLTENELLGLYNELQDNATVYGIPGSTAEAYFKEKGVNFEVAPGLAELTYDLGGGTASAELPSGYYAVGDEITVTAAMWQSITRTGYTMGTVTCNGSSVTYFNFKSGRYLSTAHTMTEDGLNFVVNWTANTYTVTFDQNGGTGGAPESATFTYGSPYSLADPVAPTRDNYVFEGYYFTVTSGKQTLKMKLFNADMTAARARWEIASDVALTAKWTLKEVDVGDDFIADDLIYTVLTKEDGNYTVSVSGNTLLYVSDLVIPETVTYNSDTYTVTEIADGDFSWNSQTSSHIITGVFANEEFNSVTLPNTITRIGDYAFYNANISEIVLSESLEVIECGAFDNVYLTHIELPNGLLEIEHGAFLDSDLVEITIPESVTKIYNNAFQGCKDLVKVKILNPDTVIYGDVFILSDNEEMVIYGYADSTTQEFCENYDYAFSVFLELTWDLGGGTASAVLPSGYYAVGDEITVTAAMWQNITRTGYTMGTVTCNGSNVTYVNSKSGRYLSTTHTMTEDGLSFVVNWTANTYTVTFDQNGGTGGAPESATFTYGSPYSLTDPVAPTRDNYVFEGYYFTVTSGKQTLKMKLFNADMTAARARWEIASDVTLKADWTPTVTGIEIPAGSQSQTYAFGADFVPFNITAAYGDGSSEEVAVSEEMLSGFSTDTAGTRTATVTYEGKTATFEYTVNKPVLRINSAYLVLSDNINVIYRTTVDEFYSDPRMEFEFNGKTYTVTEYKIDANGKYCYEFAGVVPQKIGDNISATLYATGGDGVEVSVNVPSYSVRQYCVNQYSKTTDESLKRLISDLLVYGEKTQIYQDYKTDQLVTEGLSLTPSTFVELDSSYNKQALTGTIDPNVKYSSANLLLSNEISVQFGITSQDPTPYTFEVTLGSTTRIFTAEDLVYKNGKYYLTFKGIKPLHFDETITAVIKQDGVPLDQTVEYSVYTYIQKNQNTQNEALRELLRAIFNYGQSAGNYAGK